MTVPDPDLNGVRYWLTPGSEWGARAPQRHLTSSTSSRTAASPAEDDGSGSRRPEEFGRRPSGPIRSQAIAARAARAVEPDQPSNFERRDVPLGRLLGNAEVALNFSGARPPTHGKFVQEPALTGMRLEGRFRVIKVIRVAIRVMLGSGRWGLCPDCPGSGLSGIVLRQRSADGQLLPASRAESGSSEQEIELREAPTARKHHLERYVGMVKDSKEVVAARTEAARCDSRGHRLYGAADGEALSRL